jgi:uridine phosphorylase
MSLAFYTPLSTIRHALLAAFPAKFISKKDLAGAIPLVTSGEFSIVGPAIGAPSAALICHKLAELKCDSLILISFCGGVNEHLNVGDIVFPRGGIVEEGTSKLYTDSDVILDPNAVSDIQQKLERAITANETTKFFKGPVWTTDAPYCENVEKITRLKARGAFVVDMEYTALHTVCNQLGLKFGSIFIVSDRVEKDRGVQNNNKLKASLRYLCEQLVAISHSISQK